MNVLIVGSGGREHAIAYCVAKSPKADSMEIPQYRKRCTRAG